MTHEKFGKKEEMWYNKRMAQRLQFTDAEKGQALEIASKYIEAQFGEGILKGLTNSRGFLRELCNITGMTEGNRNALCQLFADRGRECGDRDPTAQDFAQTVIRVSKILKKKG
jgi:hypothetical protein